MKKLLLTGCALLLSPIAYAEFTFLLGMERWGRTIENNADQTWVGLEWTGQDNLIWELKPFARVMGGVEDTGEFLGTVGLAFRFSPFESLPEFDISLRTGPSYTDVGKPHTSEKFNWSTDIRIRYRFLQVGYAHTSNGGLGDVNSGLDMVLVGIHIPFGDGS